RAKRSRLATISEYFMLSTPDGDTRNRAITYLFCPNTGGALAIHRQQSRAPAPRGARRQSPFFAASPQNREARPGGQGKIANSGKMRNLERFGRGRVGEPWAGGVRGFRTAVQQVRPGNSQEKGTGRLSLRI